MYYFENMNLKDIAEKMGYKNDKVAKNMKCKAMRKIREAYKKGIADYVENSTNIQDNKLGDNHKRMIAAA